MQDVARNPYSLGIVGLAVVLALGISLAQPALGLALGAGLLVLIIALISTQTALYLLIVSMLFSPEIAIGGAIGKGVGGRPVTLRLEDLLLIIIGVAWLVKAAIYKELPLFKWTPINGPILYYLLACLLSTTIGMLTGDVKSKAGFFYIVKYFEYFFVFFMVVNHITNKTQVVRCLIAILLTCFLVSLYGISQFPSGERATAPFEGEIGEPNTLGGYLVLMMALVIGLLIHLPSFPTRTSLMILLSCMVFALMATQSRSSYFAAAVLAVSVIVLQWRKPMIVGTVLVGVVGVLLLAPASVKERLLFTFAQPREAGQIQVGGVHLDTSTSDRLRAWQAVLGYWAQRPLLGKGVASTWWADAQYVKVLVETGLVGLTAFLFIIFRLWKGVRESFRIVRDPWGRGLAYGFLLGLIPLLVHALGANTFIIVRIMEPFWFLAGLVMLLPMLERKRGNQGDSRMVVQVA